VLDGFEPPVHVYRSSTFRFLQGVFFLFVTACLYSGLSSTVNSKSFQQLLKTVEPMPCGCL
jgi:hypothetical protein